jgi:hypothetical protein
MHSNFYQQPSTTVSAPQQTWDGKRWVNAKIAPTGTTSSFQSSWLSNGSVAQQQPSSSVPPNPVHAYTAYYHHYTQELALWKSQRPNHVHAEATIKWLQYQADQSSRAAHFFHQNPSASAAPFDLPAPPGTNDGVYFQQQPASSPDVSPPQQPFPSSSPRQYSHRNAQLYGSQSSSTPLYQRQQQQQHHPSQSYNNSQQPTVVPQPEADDDDNDPESLKHFVNRSLAQCKTPEQRAAVMQQIQSLLQEALEQGTMHSKDWSSAVVAVDGADLRGQKESPSADSSARGAENGIHRIYGTCTSATPSRSEPKKRSSSGEGIDSLTPSIMPKRSRWAPFIATPEGLDGPSPSSLTASSKKKSKSSNHSTTIRKTNSSKKKKENSSYYGPGSDDINDDFSGNNRKKKDHGFISSSSTMKDRARRFSGPGGITEASTSSSSRVDIDDRYLGKSMIGGGGPKELTEADYEQMTCKGKNQTLEKDYLRLTAPPRPELVRPQHILESHLENLTAELDCQARRDYLWFCSQLKAIRQDCTVQRLQNSFAVKVYETHARIALQEGDLNEYNQCQTQLKDLYNLLLSGDNNDGSLPNRSEFLAYRLMYYVFLTENEKYSGGSSDLFHSMLSLTPKERDDPAIRHALAVRQAVAEMDYHGFFRLQKDSPNLGSLLMEYMVPTIRHKALLRICKAYHPLVDVKFVLGELGYETETESDLEFGRKWLLSCACVLTDDGSEIKTKGSVVSESDMKVNT